MTDERDSGKRSFVAGLSAASRPARVQTTEPSSAPKPRNPFAFHSAGEMPGATIEERIKQPVKGAPWLASSGGSVAVIRSSKPGPLPVYQLAEDALVQVGELDPAELASKTNTFQREDVPGHSQKEPSPEANGAVVVYAKPVGSKRRGRPPGGSLTKDSPLQQQRNAKRELRLLDRAFRNRRARWSGVVRALKDDAASASTGFDGLLQKCAPERREELEAKYKELHDLLIKIGTAFEKK